MSEIKDKTSKGMAWSGIMSLLQQVLGIVFSIVIARILDPSDYGMVGMLTIFTALATCLQDGGFVWALTNRTNVNQKQYSSILWLNLTISVTLYLVLFFCAPLIAQYFAHPELLWLSRYIFLGIIFSSLGLVQTAYLYKEVKVRERTIASITGLIVSGIIGVVMAYSGFSYWGIATQVIINIGISTLVLWILSPFRPIFCIDWRFLRNIIPDGVRFVIPNVFAVVGSNIFSIILGKKYTVTDVGIYTQANRWNTAAYSIILGTMRNVSQPVFVKVREDKEQHIRVFRKLFRMAAFLIIPIMLGLAMVSDEFIEVLLTSKWSESSLILRTLSIGGCVCVLSSTMSYFIMSLNRTKLYMYFGILMSSLDVICAIIASYWGVHALAYSYTTLTIVSFVLCYIFINQTHKYSLWDLMKDLIPVIVITGLSLLFSYLVTIGIDSKPILLTTRIVLSIISYISLMHIIKYDSFIEILYFVLKR